MVDMIGQPLEIRDRVICITPGNGTVYRRIETIDSFHGKTKVGFSTEPGYSFKRLYMAKRCIKLSQEQINFIDNA